MRRANDRHFSGERAHYSGAQKQKRAKERQRKENEAMLSCERLAIFFKGKSVETEAHAYNRPSEEINLVQNKQSSDDEVVAALHTQSTNDQQDVTTGDNIDPFPMIRTLLFQVKNI